MHKFKKNKDTKTQPESVPITISMEKFPPEFSNTVNFTFSDDGIVITMIYKENENAVVLGRYLITAAHAKEIIKLLKKNLE